jgi:hypothetical protein
MTIWPFFLRSILRDDRPILSFASKISNFWPESSTERYDLPAPNHITRENNVGERLSALDRLMATQVQSTKRKRGTLRKLLTLGGSIGIGGEAADRLEPTIRPPPDYEPGGRRPVSE